MKSEINRRVSPEEQELERKQAKLALLEAELAERELSIATLKAEMFLFERRYFRIIGSRLAELDELEALIAEALAEIDLNNVEIRKRAKAARASAQKSAKATEGAKQTEEPAQFAPSENLKRLYREAAKKIHPDLAPDEASKERRTRLMAKLNEAYQRGDESMLRSILDEWEHSPEAVPGGDIAAELVRVIRKIALASKRISAIRIEESSLRRSDLFQLWERSKQAEAEGRDMLAEMTQRLDEQIRDARAQLDRLTRVVRKHERQPS
jgi:hypothetical protein